MPFLLTIAFDFVSFYFNQLHAVCISYGSFYTFVNAVFPKEFLDKSD